MGNKGFGIRGFRAFRKSQAIQTSPRWLTAGFAPFMKQVSEEQAGSVTRSAEFAS